MSPTRISRIKFEDADAVCCGEGFSPRGMEYHVLKHRVLWAIVALEFAGHVAEAVFPHIEIGSVEPMLIGDPDRAQTFLTWRFHRRPA